MDELALSRHLFMVKLATRRILVRPTAWLIQSKMRFYDPLLRD